MKFISKLQKFMKGRYGPDDLYNFLFFVYIILIIISLFFNNIILFLLELFILIIMFYRFFSKDIYKRSNENKKFLKLKKQLRNPFNNIKRNKLDKEHVYKKCFKCKTTLKLPLPSKRGIKHAKCPKCGRRITFFTFKQEQIEIIIDGKKVKRK